MNHWTLRGPMNIHRHYQQDHRGRVEGAHRKWAGRLGWWCHWPRAQQRVASVWRAPPSGWCRCPGRQRPSGRPVAAWIAAVGNMVTRHLHNKEHIFEICHTTTLFGTARVGNSTASKDGRIEVFWSKTIRATDRKRWIFWEFNTTLDNVCHRSLQVFTKREQEKYKISFALA